MSSLQIHIARLLSEEKGAAGIEWLLATGALATVIAVALIAAFELFVPEVLKLLCDTVDPLGPADDCISFL